MSSLSPRLRTTARLATTALLFAAGVAVGWLLRETASNRQEAATGEPATRLIRGRSAPPWKYINPLLECETAEAYLRNPALSTAKLRVGAFIASHLKEGGVVHASAYYRQLHDGPWFGINERDSYAPGSLLKIPTLIAVLKRAEGDPGLLSRRLTFDEPDDLNRLMVYQPPDPLRRGGTYTVDDLCRRMVAFSDNNATRLLNGFVTQEQVDRMILALGLMTELQLSGGKLSIKSLSSLFRVLYNASILSPEMSELALEMLSHSSFREGILAGLPPGVPASSKYGEAWVDEDLHQLHEFAIVYHRDRPYLLGVMTLGRDYQQMREFIGDLSRLVYEDVESSLHPDGKLETGPAPD